eukprot:CAMPEP_0184871508 /NCGR_PEP_ID=MMETSP0580-20130426/40756_1 /TAXON_ID=1118495 /ORGANISM="Dactyliosolen fragilissimus" /LENGTH=2372 /DNA_ID=CAMNT_0027374173 /DNA_START=995 /DNA_END=8116 /DNA_ORIENTATION=+
MCPSFIFLSKENYKAAGLAVGGLLLDGKVKEGSWNRAPFGCSINVKNGWDIIYNSFHGENNGDYQPVCSKGSFTLLPKSFIGGCPSSMNVSKEDCAAAGLSAGGKLPYGKNFEVTWDYAPFGCFISSVNSIVHYNSDNTGVNNGYDKSVCHELPFVKIYGLPKCPLESPISEEDCAVAGLSVGGILQHNELIVDAWDNKPSGCFLTKGDKIIHFNNHPIGAKSGDHISVCHKIKAEDFIVLPPKHKSRCPSSIKVSRDDCSAAGLAVGGILKNDSTLVEGSWDDKPSGCSFGPEIHFNNNPDGMPFQTDSSVCHKMKGVVEVPPKREKCPSGKEVLKQDCIAAGLTVGADQRGGLLFDRSWNNRPSGCFVEEIGNKFIYFNTNANPSQIQDSESVSLLCQWECTQPHSTQHPESLGCQCDHGYVSQETGEQILRDDDDRCISALLSAFIRTTQSTITYTSTIVTEMKDVKLTQRAPANDIVIDLSEKFSKKSTSKANGDVEYSYTFSGLNPGHRYNIKYSYVQANGEEKDMKFPAVTSCSACGSQMVDKTGPPTNFKTSQDNGHVMFTFEDCSLCEEAYSFTRTSYEEGNNIPVSFTRDYYFISMQEYGSFINPLTEASDNLAKSKLVVGKDYKYCVRAINPVLYMDHPFDHEGVGRTLLSSSDTCADHRIQWEASIHGKVTTEPNAGSLPIEEVTVTYQLLSEDKETPMDCDGCSGTQETTDGGTFDIVFNVNNETLYEKNTHEIPVKVTFSKSTTGDNNTIIDHQFLCNEGEDNCSGDVGTIVYLSHLQFREPLHIYDDTSVPFSGKVSIADTSYSGALEGCALADVEVCLIHERNVGVMKTNETLVCGKTDPDGTYSVSVVVGSRVDYINVMYHNHKFEPSSDSSFEPGTVIQAEAYYHGMDFVDTEKARLMVDVVGGLCNENIGISVILIKIVGCDGHKMKMTQVATRGIYNNVPAHLVDVQVVQIKDTTTKKRHKHIWRFFQGDRPLVRTIDLRSTGTADTAIEEERGSLSNNATTGINSKDDIKQEEKKNIEAIAEEEEEDLELVRFQYDGELQMKVSVSHDSLQCSNYLSNGGNSFHVLDYMKPFVVTVDLKYEIIKDKVYCDIVDSNELKLRVENQVGVDDNQGFDDFYNSISDDLTKKALDKCKDGCLYDIGHDVDEEGNLSSAHVTDWFATGRPNIAAPFTKSMIFTIQGGTGHVTHKADFVVEGYYSKGPGRSFALPTHKPVMILRDPPGGLSYATYENVVTTLKLETSSTSTSVHNKFGFGIKNVFDVTNELCAGGGLGAIVINCLETVGKEGEIQLFKNENNLGFITQMSDETRSNQFSTTWSYQTSSDPWTAGPMSDVFVVPNLNVMYQEVIVVEWDNATCSVATDGNGTLPITTTFNIEDTENQPALSFFSRYHINNVKIPELKAAKTSKTSQKHDCGCTNDDPNKSCKYFEADGVEKTTTCREITIEIGSLQQGIDGWNTAFKDEKDTLESNTNDASKSINNWFEEFGKKDMHDEDSVLITDHNSGLAPPSLINNKEPLNQTFYEVADKPVKRIQFSGGGNTFSMTMNKEKVWNEVELSCWKGCNNEYESDIQGPGLSSSRFTVFGVGMELEATLLDLNVHVVHQSTKGETDTTQTSIGFVLGDEDPQDEFVVDLFYDDKFGTVIFETIAGQSKCPHEPNTAAIEDPRLIISRRPSQYVFPEEDMVFEIEMTNVGVGDESQFVLYAQHRDNDGSLKLLLDGAPFEGSREFTNILKDTTYKKTLVVQRGPLAYQFSPLDLILESACEDSSSSANDLTASIFDETKSTTEKLYNVLEDKDTYLIKFVEPCPKVEWAGELNRDRLFVVNTESDDPDNLEVSVFNPNHDQSKFHNMTSDRLENVFLYYREVGDLHWSKARTEITNEDGSTESLTIDFAAEYSYEEESDYGYSSLKWSLANKVPEGTYEIRIDSECDKVGGPADMDVYSTPILSGVIDLTRPEQYGRALPLRESVLIGEEMAVVFTEPVRCEAFDLLVTVDSIGVKLDRNDPPIQIVCDGRKVGFQIDPTQINVEDWIGMNFTVEMGKINTATTESLSNLFDLNGNAIKMNVEFEKIFANINLDQASTSFTVTLNNMNHCSNVENPMCSDEIKEKITTLLDLNSSDQSRIEVESVSAALSNAGGDGVVSARVNILPTDQEGGTRMLRNGETSKSASNNTNHSVSIFRDLQSAVEKNLNQSRMLVAENSNESPTNLNNMVIVVSDMKILPSDLDMKLVTTDLDVIEEEEDLYHYGSMKGNNAALSQPILSKVEEIKKEQRGMMKEMKEESKIREEAMMSKIERMSDVEDALFRELKESKEKLLQFELMKESKEKLLQFELVVVVTLASVGIALVAYLSLRQK